MQMLASYIMTFYVNLLALIFPGVFIFSNTHN